MATAKVGFKVTWKESWPGVEPSPKILSSPGGVSILKGAKIPDDHPLVAEYPEYFRKERP
jgi:hypothetical protein